MPGAKHNGGLLECSWAMNSHSACITCTWRGEGVKIMGHGGVHPSVCLSVHPPAGRLAGRLASLPWIFRLFFTARLSATCGSNQRWALPALCHWGPSGANAPGLANAAPRTAPRGNACVVCQGSHPRVWCACRTPAAGSAIWVTLASSSLGLWANGPPASGPPNALQLLGDPRGIGHCQHGTCAAILRA